MQTIVVHRELTTAAELGEALADLADGEITYVIGPDNRPIEGFKLVEETLSDGSRVQNVILLARQDPS